MNRTKRPPDKSTAKLRENVIDRAGAKMLEAAKAGHTLSLDVSACEADDEGFARLTVNTNVPIEKAEGLPNLEAFPALVEALEGMLKAFPPPPIRSANGTECNLAHAAARTALRLATNT